MRYFREHEDGEDEVVLLHATAAFRKRNADWMMLIKDPKHGSSEQEDQKQRENHDCAESEGFAAISDVFAGEYSLDDKLFRAMRRHDHDGAADYAHPNVERRTEREFGIEPMKFAGGTSFGEDTADAPIQQRGNVAD